MNPQKTILDLTNKEAEKFLLENNNYINFDIPVYFDFSIMFEKILDIVGDKDIKTFLSGTKKPGNCVYIKMVKILTNENNWNLIIDRFKEFENNGYIKCKSLPIVSDSSSFHKAEQVINWGQTIEQESISLGLDYEYSYKLAKKVFDNNIKLWNSDWVGNRKINKVLKETKVISKDKMDKLDFILDTEEVSLFF